MKLMKICITLCILLCFNCCVIMATETMHITSVSLEDVAVAIENDEDLVFGVGRNMFDSFKFVRGKLELNKIYKPDEFGRYVPFLYDTRNGKIIHCEYSKDYCDDFIVSGLNSYDTYVFGGITRSDFRSLDIGFLRAF